jgi:hypothetical protein
MAVATLLDWQVALLLVRPPSTGHQAAQQQQQPHPVWGVAAPAVGSYVALLRLLCSEELARLRVWVEPMKYAEAAKAAPAVSFRPV